MNSNQAIMISYKTENRATADELFVMLEAAGLVPWMDYRGIEPGMKWRDELIRQVRTCNAFVALLTPNYIRSEHCRMEILIARSRRCPILPVEVEECIDLLDSYEETKGLADTFMVRLQRSSLVGLPIRREQALERLVSAALSIDQTPFVKKAYIAYCSNEAAVATQIASQLEQAGISTWIATKDCRIGDNWRQAQAYGVANAAAQVIVIDETIADADVLRTEIILSGAFGLPVFTVLGESLSKDDTKIACIMRNLRSADITYRRLTDIQPFRSDHDSIAKLAKVLESIVM
jgi:hypothetical protein